MDEGKFQELLERDWKETFFDSGQDDWRENWFVDGHRADLRNTPDGMFFAAGPVIKDNGCHAVLWTKQEFSGDVRIEFDYTRLDTVLRFVNILYIQATGVGEGPYAEDILEWAQLRQVPFMRSYFKNMNLLHVSYAAFGNKDDDKEDDYVRARRYPVRPDRTFQETALPPDNELTGLFQPGVTYHFTFVKTDDDLFFEVKNEEVRKLFHWPLAEEAPLAHGRVGIRHMWTRCARYANVKIMEHG